MIIIQYMTYKHRRRVSGTVSLVKLSPSGGNFFRYIAIMGSKFEGVLISEADVEDISRTALRSLMLFVFCHAVHTCIFGAALSYIGKILLTTCDIGTDNVSGSLQQSRQAKANRLHQHRHIFVARQNRH